MRPDCVSICRSDGSREGTGVIHPNIQRGPYGVRDRHRHPVRAVDDRLCQGLRAQSLCHGINNTNGKDEGEKTQR